MGWRKGDLALCTKMGPWRWLLGGALVTQPGPMAGQILTVRNVGWFAGKTILWLEGYPGERPNDAWTASRFRKIPAHKADAFDRAGIAALNSEPVHAPNNDAVHNSCQREGFACPDLGQVGSAG